jgi:hypothetical protein
MLSEARLERLERAMAETVLAELATVRAQQPYAYALAGAEAAANRRIFLRAMRDVLARRGDGTLEEFLGSDEARLLDGDTPESEAADRELMRAWCDRHGQDFEARWSRRHADVARHLRWTAALNSILDRLPRREAQRVVDDLMSGSRRSVLSERVRHVAADMLASDDEDPAEGT